MPDVQCYQILVEKPTSTPIYGPIWEKPLLQAIWRAAGVSAEKITTRKIAPDHPYVGHLSKYRFKSIEVEISRLAQKYETNPSNSGAPLFDIVYPGDTLFAVIEAEMRRYAQGAAEPSRMENDADSLEAAADEVPEHLRLERLYPRGGGKEVLLALKRAKITSIDALASKRPSELEPLPHIGMKSASRIINRATAYLAEQEVLPGVMPIAPGAGSSDNESAATPLQQAEQQDRADGRSSAEPFDADGLDDAGNDVFDSDE